MVKLNNITQYLLHMPTYPQLTSPPISPFPTLFSHPLANLCFNLFISQKLHCSLSSTSTQPGYTTVSTTQTYDQAYTPAISCDSRTISQNMESLMASVMAQAPALFHQVYVLKGKPNTTVYIRFIEA